jgi:hypothetical protein
MLIYIIVVVIVVFILCRVFIMCVVLCAVFRLIVVLFCVMCVICVSCLIVVPLPPGKNPLAVIINNMKVVVAYCSPYTSIYCRKARQQPAYLPRIETRTI